MARFAPQATANQPATFSIGAARLNAHWTSEKGPTTANYLFDWLHGAWTVMGVLWKTECKWDNNIISLELWSILFY